MKIIFHLHDRAKHSNFLTELYVKNAIIYTNSDLGNLLFLSRQINNIVLP